MARNGLAIVVVGERGSRRTIAAALLAVALPAFQFLEKRLPALDAFEGELRFRSEYGVGSPGFSVNQRGEKVLMQGDQIGAVLARQLDPRGHVGIVDTTLDGVVDPGRSAEFR